MHNYTNEDTLSLFFDVKGEVIIIIHYVHVLKTINIPNNDEENSTQTILQILNVLELIESKITNIRF